MTQSFLGASFKMWLHPAFVIDCCVSINITIVRAEQQTDSESQRNVAVRGAPPRRKLCDLFFHDTDDANILQTLHPDAKLAASNALSRFTLRSAAKNKTSGPQALRLPPPRRVLHTITVYLLNYESHTLLQPQTSLWPPFLNYLFVLDVLLTHKNGQFLCCDTIIQI